MTGVLELLLTQGSDVDVLNDDRCTPLFFATRSNNYYGAKVLLENGMLVVIYEQKIDVLHGITLNQRKRYFFFYSLLCSSMC